MFKKCTLWADSCVCDALEGGFFSIFHSASIEKQIKNCYTITIY